MRSSSLEYFSENLEEEFALLTLLGATKNKNAHSRKTRSF
jgi:hypothetical protein